MNDDTPVIQKSAKSGDASQQPDAAAGKEAAPKKKQGRGAKLKDSPELFSGLVWSGQRSVELGLADALGSVDSVARDVIKADDVVDFTQQESLADRVARKFGASVGRTAASLMQRTPRWR